MVTLAVAALTYLQMTRSAGFKPYEVVWGEDGEVFLSGALGEPLPAPLLEPYAGYLHTVPRVLVEAVALLRPEHMAFAVALAASLVVAVLAAFVWWASGRLLDSQLLRAVLAGAFALTPAGGWDMTATLAHLHFFLLYAAFWALLVAWRDRPAALLAGAVTLATALSSTLAALLVPLAAYTALRNRADRTVWIAPAGLLLGLIVQAVKLGDQAPAGDLALSAIPELLGERVAGVLAVTERYVPQAADAFGSLFTWLALLALVAVGAAAIIAARPRLPAVACALYALAFFVVPIAARRPPDLGAELGLAGPRYTYLPVLLVVTLFALAADRRPRLAAAVAIYATTLVIGSYGVPSSRAAGPQWAVQVEGGRRWCQEPQANLANLQIVTSAAGWNVRMPCRRLR